jgi:antitoxin MazE
MSMKVKMSKWGNSLAVRIPSAVVQEAEIYEGICFDIETLGDGGLRLMPLRTAPTLDELVAGITDENKHGEADWGEPVGNEAW